MKIEEKAIFLIIGEIVTKARPRTRVVNGQYAQIYTLNKNIVYEKSVMLSYND